MSTIDTLEQLRELFDAPKGRALQKQLSSLDAHCRTFIDTSPFVVLASYGGDTALATCSPRGGQPGFAQVTDENTVLLPDSSGNNRLDTLENIVANGRLGLLFMIPGMDETLRINASATLKTDAELLSRWAGERRAPKLVIEAHVEQAYLHCAKALMRARLWGDEFRIERSELPTMNRMIADQIGTTTMPESQSDMLTRYEQEIAEGG